MSIKHKIKVIPRYNHWFWHRGVFGWFWNIMERWASKINNWIWRKRWAKRP